MLPSVFSYTDFLAPATMADNSASSASAGDVFGGASAGVSQASVGESRASAGEETVVRASAGSPVVSVAQALKKARAGEASGNSRGAKRRNKNDEFESPPIYTWQEDFLLAPGFDDTSEARCGRIHTPHDLGDGPKYAKYHFAINRAKLLNLVHLRSPKLPLPLESVWGKHGWAFAKNCPELWKFTTGTRFLQEINLLIATLGVHYHGHAEVKAKQSLAVKAWLKEHCKKTDDPRAFEDFVHGLEAWLPKSSWELRA
jgi:hypothetical protein